MEKMGFAHERGSLQPLWVWVREREGVIVGVGEREGVRGLRETNEFGTEMRRVWLVRDKIVF